MCVQRGGVPKSRAPSQRRGRKRGWGWETAKECRGKGCPLTTAPRPPGKIRRNVWRFPQTWRGFSGSLWPSLGTVLITIINYQ